MRSLDNALGILPQDNLRAMFERIGSLGESSRHIAIIRAFRVGRSIASIGGLIVLILVDLVPGGTVVLRPPPAINACEKCGHWHVMAETRILRDRVTCNAAIGACAKSASWASALSLLQSMPVTALQPGTITYNTAPHPNPSSEYTTDAVDV